MKMSYSMGAVGIEQKRPFFTVAACDGEEEDLGMIMEENEIEIESSSSSSSLIGSSSSLDSLDDGATSSPSSSSGSLLDLSDLMSSLPIKRGLSKFYHGKSQSFTSLARVTSVEDLPKKAASDGGGGYARRMKACRSYGGGLNMNNLQQQQQRGALMSCSSPRAIISKKTSPLASCLRGKINHTNLLIPANLI